MLFKHFEYASLRCSWQIVHERTISLVTSLWRHFHRINTTFLHSIHNLCRKVCANLRASTPSCCEDIARKKTGQKYAPNGWRVAREPSGRRVFSPGLSLSKWCTFSPRNAPSFLATEGHNFDLWPVSPKINRRMRLFSVLKTDVGIK